MLDELKFDAALEFDLPQKWSAFQAGAVKCLLHNRIVLRLREIRAAMESCGPEQLVRHQAALQEVKKVLELLNVKDIRPIGLEIQKTVKQDHYARNS